MEIGKRPIFLQRKGTEWHLCSLQWYLLLCISYARAPGAGAESRHAHDRVEEASKSASKKKSKAAVKAQRKKQKK